MNSGVESATTRIVLLTMLAMVAFAANSLLCRLALGGQLIDPASFASVRVISAATILLMIMWPRRRRRRRGSRALDGYSVLMLFLYMVLFSFAYVSLSAGTGALILFGVVQMTMLAAAIRNGERFSLLAWAGLAIALLGLLYLVSPGLEAPDPVGAVFMAGAGVSWGVYSLLGRKAADPLEVTARNFVLCVPLSIVVSIAFLHRFQISLEGALLAIASGALASGLGYAVWYAALQGLSAGRAATVQLSVPILAAIGGVVLLSEDLSNRLVLASVFTLGGIAMVLTQRHERRTV